MDNLVSETDLVRARSDPAFRQHLLAFNLDRLLEALKRLRRSGNPNPESARQMREAVDLAVELANRLHAHGGSPPRAA
jgi:hypothetical protein